MKRLLLIILVVLTSFGAWSQNRITQGAVEDYTVQLKSGEANNAKYTWLVTPANGTSTDLSVIEGNSAQIVWDGPLGLYTLSVQVIDGNGCLSESISQEIEIVTTGELVFASDYPNTLTCSELQDGSASGSGESIFKVVYSGDSNLASTNITILNPEGNYVDTEGNILADQQNPEITVTNPEDDKEIDITISDSWENTSNEKVEFEITLISATTTDSVKIDADTNADVVRNIEVLTKPVIEFN